MVKTGVKPDAFREFGKTFSACGTFLKIDKSWSGYESYRKVTFFTGHILDTRHGHELDMLLAVALRKVGGYGAEITVIGWKSSIQLGHKTANSEVFIDKNDIFFCFS
jgi:hypothetical protein